MIGRREAGVLAALKRRSHYGAELIANYERWYKENMPKGTIYTFLGRLESKKLVRSKVRVNGQKGGGAPRKYFFVTPEGRRELTKFALYSKMLLLLRG
jgi:DNA-binding PadR family transcriptional regulator